MSSRCVVNVDLVDVWREPGRKTFIHTLAWGDEVAVTGQTSMRVAVETVRFVEQPGPRIGQESIGVGETPFKGHSASHALFQAVSPVVSIISSGDESAQKEYIHPRATLVGALGKWSRVPEPLIFVTELVAFFNVEGWSRLSNPKTKAQKERDNFFWFSRTAFGIVKTRTNGKRLFVYTDSGNTTMKEAYAYELDSSGFPQPAEVRRG